jgi:hypothetical protein
MRATPTYATRARSLLHRAAARLGTADPLGDVGPLIDESLAVPLGAPLPGDALAAGFSEQTPDHLNFVLRAEGPGVTPADRMDVAGHALSRIVGDHFGGAARRWVDSRLEPLSAGAAAMADWGAAFGSAYDRNGLTESFMHCEWSPGLMEALPATLHRLARTAAEMLPGLRPAISTIRCGRTAGSQQISFEIDRPLALASLQPLMEAFGLGHRHAGLMSAVAFILGARFRLPPEAAMLTLRPTRQGVELRLDVNLDAIPDLPPQLMALTRLQMTERPRSVQGLDRWLMALTPDGYPGPGTVSVLSVWVRPDLPARIALFLRPAALAAEHGEAAPAPAPRLAPRRERPAAPAPAPVAAAAAGGWGERAEWSSSAWAPRH